MLDRLAVDTLTSLSQTINPFASSLLKPSKPPEHPQSLLWTLSIMINLHRNVACRCARANTPAYWRGKQEHYASAIWKCKRLYIFGSSAFWTRVHQNVMKKWLFSKRPLIHYTMTPLFLQSSKLVQNCQLNIAEYDATQNKYYCNHCNMSEKPNKIKDAFGGTNKKNIYFVHFPCDRENIED